MLKNYHSQVVRNLNSLYTYVEPQSIKLSKRKEYPNILRIMNTIYSYTEPYSMKLSERKILQINSHGRKIYEKLFSKQKISEQVYTPDEKQNIILWGIRFRSALFNSAGMFKNGDGYELCAKLGAGAYLGGTSTYNPRKGNTREGIHMPFIRLQESQISINALGLPNKGDDVISKKLEKINKIDGFPLGWSVTRSPDFSLEEAQEYLIKSLFLYHDNRNVDFIEINESCPNIKKSGISIVSSLKYISEEFLKKRKRKLPVIIKLSNDISFDSLKQILQCMISLKYDGINLGNTSTDYSNLLKNVSQKEQKIFSYFTQVIGGGIGGKILKTKSLELCKFASEEVKKLSPTHEFHIIRNGGIENLKDVEESISNGASLTQWQTGFFNLYIKHGNNIYKHLYESELKSKCFKEDG